MAHALVRAVSRVISTPALDQGKSCGLRTNPALTELFSMYARIFSNSLWFRTQWPQDSFCQKGSPVRPSSRLAKRALAPLSDLSK